MPPGGAWMEVVPHLHPSYGGISTIVPQLASQLAAQSFTLDIAAFCDPAESVSVPLHSSIALAHWPQRRFTRSWPGDALQRFRDRVRSADGLHIHGVWESATSVAASTARSLHKPYIISAHGMLQPWALRSKSFKKRLYSALVEKANLQKAACLHALTTAEAADYRSFGRRGPIAVIPNGVELPQSIDATLFLEQFPMLRGRRIVLFLGRIHFKKGLDILIRAWAAIEKNFPDTILVLAGPDSENSRAAVEKLAEECGISARIHFTGMLAAGMKWSALANSYGFVLPSYSEGLSVAALEAMGVGLPVILTRHCHMPEVRRLDAGWEIEATTPALTLALEEMLANSSAANAAIGGRARRLVCDRYSWPVVAAQMADLYRWVQGGPSPHSFDVWEGRP
jgi:glycosyltransferase involved in cell wall biosynthesis